MYSVTHLSKYVGRDPQGCEKTVGEKNYDKGEWGCWDGDGHRKERKRWRERGRQTEREVGWLCKWGHQYSW